MNNNLTFLISFIFLASCSFEEPIQQEPDILDDIYFTEFMSLVRQVQILMLKI